MSKILFTGGLGDIFSVESRMTDAEKFSVREIYLATPGAKFIKQALKYHYLWADIEPIEVLTKDQIKNFSPSRYCIHTLPELVSVCKAAGISEPPSGIVDMGIIRIFADIRTNRRPWNKSGFAFPRVKCDIAFNPATTSGDYRISNRNFTESEIVAVKEYAQKNELEIKELGEGITTFEEYVGYTQGCREFIGVDSAASILAAIDKVTFKDKKIFIRSQNKTWYAHRAEWYPPDAMDFFYGSEYK